jgi:hypothetical protein
MRRNETEDNSRNTVNIYTSTNKYGDTGGERGK